MIRIISLDMDGTLVNSRFVDKVWMEGMPRLYAESTGLDLPAAREYVIGEYMKIGSDHLEWYDLKFWIDKFGLSIGKEELLELYEDEIEVYPEVEEVLELLSENYELVVTSNAAREFIDIELDGLQGYFREVFSATSDFREVKKSPLLYGAICAHLDARPFEVLHIGDHYSYDYESALDAGLDALFLDRRGERQGPEVIGDLREAVELIGGCA
ncbi:MULTISPECIES: HAD family hydrolase [Methanothrix]|jgi:putative hydrolase of the HAD superfamily|uniref:HAD-superfamily hydrolase, subfamily IA, variant 1 n=1 Tax=Methanothrix soehngenii (strain ATCC 5969 / DSM 3671 / JCM 10134 / NBRC 103675 / OCM 69 / GP-6) TaxID=990316 RepID=F4BZZ1_METSG|nr:MULTISPECIES: HAD family hydrolase [Methanothrix]HOC66456.1 HAD family hydrolase [Methanothrix soehngenii]AEB69136.1 HAD-superfamily hydrolase, subfamily IA, variant 1 [Methanothrix soehngenii GP6]HOE45638.1 HAD family hydrolase [Methanothrix soehngenii]HOS22219.1 HAD family hydrolase [Methanothrix soehngenii]HPL20596.1 HAD family hydrolase [Methanothrix soehngenii]